MPQQRPEQKKTVGRVMHEFKHGELESSHGRKVRNPRQAVAIALSEAGASNQNSAETNRRQLSRTKSKERHGQTAQQRKEGRHAMDRRHEPTRAELYREAQKKDVRGRSRMSKDELRHALHAA
ncbi:MAG: DUF6496 domain-containing protein [Acetobacteraceae bacterium]